MPAKYHIHVRRVPPRFSPPGKSTVIDWNEGCLRCAKLRQGSLSGGRLPEAGLRPDAVRRHHRLDVPELLPLRPGLPQGADLQGHEPPVPPVGGRLLDAGDHRHDLVPGGNRQDPGLRGRLRRGFCRRGLRLLLDRHVGDRPAHPGRHPRPGIHQHHRRPGAQTHVSGLR